MNKQTEEVVDFHLILTILLLMGLVIFMMESSVLGVFLMWLMSVCLTCNVAWMLRDFK